MQLVNRQFFGLKRPQKIVFYDRHRHKVIVAGRRFGKTFLALLVLISSACRFRRSKNWYVAPTRTMAKDIAWEELKYLLNLDEFGLGNPLVRDVNETELTVTFINGAIIKLMGASEPDRLRGRGLKCVVLDEYADMDPQAWVVIRPQLSDKRHRLEYGELGRAMFIGTPKGYNHFKKLYDDIRQGMMGTDWSAYRFTSLDGGNIDSAEIEKAKYDLTERDFRQEYMATFESITGRVYHAFLREMYLESKEKMCGGNLCNELRDPGTWSADPGGHGLQRQSDDGHPQFQSPDEAAVGRTARDAHLEGIRHRELGHGANDAGDPRGLPRAAFAGVSGSDWRRAIDEDGEHRRDRPLDHSQFWRGPVYPEVQHELRQIQHGERDDVQHARDPAQAHQSSSVPAPGELLRRLCVQGRHEFGR